MKARVEVGQLRQLVHCQSSEICRGVAFQRLADGDSGCLEYLGGVLPTTDRDEHFGAAVYHKLGGLEACAAVCLGGGILQTAAFTGHGIMQQKKRRPGKGRADAALVFIQRKHDFHMACSSSCCCVSGRHR